jgi:CheY-like chemotaxis protein
MQPSLLFLVDDEPAITHLVSLYGTRAGHRVACFPDGRQAWKYLTGAAGEQGRPPRPHLLLLDLNLPGVSGLDLCRRLRTNPELATLPVALFTTLDRPDEIARALEVGTDFLFDKDHVKDPKDWLERLDDILLHVHGRPLTLSLSSSEVSHLCTTPEQLIATLNRALRSLLRPLGPPFLRAVSRRAFGRVRPLLGEVDAGGTPSPIDPDAWLLANGLGFDPDRLAYSLPAPAVVAFAVLLVDEIVKVLGTATTAPFRDTLAASLPILSQVVER